jgi:hypothetical protein
VIGDRYTLEREIGRGGMGVVWLGRDEVLGRTVAIKRIGLAPGSGQADVERAAREARLAATLNHPHVVAVFDLATDGAEHWLVMEYVEGRDLAALVRQEGPLPPDRVASIGAQAAEALAAANGAGIVHRDVKPSNILVTNDGQVKLTDFGIARGDSDASLTQTGLLTGSPAYLAPEVAGGGSATVASDVWSMGATLYFALAGRAPYEAENALGTLYKIVHEAPPRLPTATWLQPVIEGTMEKDPERRWTMQRVHDVLAAGPGAAAAGAGPGEEPTRVIPAVPTPEPTPEPTPAPRTTPTAAAPPPVAAPVEEPTREPVEPPTTPPPARSGGRRGWLPVLLGAAVLLVLALVLWAALSDGGEETTAGGGGTPETSRPASPTGTPSATESPSPEGPTEQEMATFVEDYLATVTEDPEAAFQRLTPTFQRQSGGIEGYSGFWGTIASARPSEIQADPGGMTVSYVVAYEEKGGGRSVDQVTLRLVEEEGRLLIAGER